MTLNDVRKAREALVRLPIEWDDNTYDALDEFISKAESYVLKRDKNVPMLLRSVK